MITLAILIIVALIVWFFLMGVDGIFTTLAGILLLIGLYFVVIHSFAPVQMFLHSRGIV